MADRRSPAGVFADIVSRITALERRISPLPTRLGARGMEVTDLDEALEYGTYWARVSAANNPVGNIALVEVFPYGPEDPGYHRIMQEARFPTITSSNQIKTWRRVLDVANGTWTPWVEVSQAIIDAVPNPAWGDVTGKPSSFPSTWSDVSGKPSTFPPSAHTHPWGDVTSKPSTFPPSSHTHPWSQITDPLVTNGDTIEASALPGDFPVGVTFGQAGTGFPSSIGTVHVVKHSDYRGFQWFYDRGTTTRVYVRAANGDTSWRDWQEVITDGDDTGWVNVTVNSGYAAQGSDLPQVRRIGKVVHARWGWSNTGVTPAAAHTVGVIPEGFRPSQSVYFRWGTNSAASVAGGVVFNGGSVEIRTPPATAPLSNAAYYLFPALTWLID